MAHSASAKKRIRQNVASRLRGHSAKSALRTAIKKFRTAVQSGDAAAATAAFHAVQKKVDRGAARNILRKGTAARIKSRLCANLTALQAA